MAAAAPYMTLANVRRSGESTRGRPYRVVVYGVEGVGKTTFAAGAPSPIFISSENGLRGIEADSFPTPRTWGDVLSAVDVLIKEDHEYKTLAIDSLDWLEPLCWAHICRAHDKRNIEDFAYAKGYIYAINEWRSLIQKIDTLAREKRMHVVAISHSQVKRVADPVSGEMDRHRLKLHERASDLWREWCDALLFGHYDLSTTYDKRTQKSNTSYSGNRVLGTQWTVGADAKNRLGLPAKIPIGWQDMINASREGDTAWISKVLESLAAEIPRLPAEERDRAFAARDKLEGSGPKLESLLNRVRLRLSEIEQEEENTPAESADGPTQ